MAEILESTTSGAPTPAPDAAAAPEDNKEPPLEFNTTFQGQKLVLRVKRDGVVADLKAAITDETQVPAKRQKLIGLVKGALPPDESKLAELVGPRGEKPPTKFLLMGTPDDKLFIDPKDRDDLPEILDDLDPDFDYQALSRANGSITPIVRSMQNLLQASLATPERMKTHSEILSVGRLD